VREHLITSVTAAGVVALLVALVGCGTDSTTDTDQTITPATPPASVSLSPDVLLTAAQMPRWNGAMGWIEQDLPPGVSALSVCVLPTAESLGAVDVLTRDFEAAGVEDPQITPDPTWPPSYGTNQVALFPDDATASAAVEAWEGATRDCAPGSAITSDPYSFQIGDRSAGSTWGVAARDTNDVCPECLRFEFLGFIAEGSAVTTVGFSLTGQDANYEEDPVAESLETALARLP
jgi:hypothetical protein